MKSPDGAICFTTCHIQDSAMYRPGAAIALQTGRWKVQPSK